jgi:tryptophan synthase alpha chain
VTRPPTRLGKRFAELRAAGERGLVAYLTAGDPSPGETAGLVCAAADAGADVIELGVPFSDPSADGPVIQHAMERALAAGGSLRGALEAVGAVRRASEVPIVLFGYYNPIFAFGAARLPQAAAEAGVDGLLTVDLPPEEAGELDDPCRAAGLDVVPLLAPTTPPDRARLHARRGSGFAYYVALTGVTGAGHLDARAVGEKLRALRPLLGALPLAVGFGVKDADSARAVAEHADAVVVGSALVAAAAEARDAASRRAAIAARVDELKRALAR